MYLFITFITGHGNIAEFGQKDNITILLLGADDRCKCLVGNKIIQLDHFRPERSSYQEISLELQNCVVTVINIQKWRQSLQKIQERTNSSSEHPCMILFVLQPDCVTRGEFELVKEFQHRFGKKMSENTIVLQFSDKNKRPQPNDESDNYLQHIVYECQRKTCDFNTNMEPNDFMKQLMKYWKNVSEMEIKKYER